MEGKKVQFLKNGLFDKEFMQSKVKTYSMSRPERYIGYMLAPGLVLVYVTMINTLRELYYMSVLPIDRLFGVGSYMTMQTTTSIVGIIMGLVINYITERTVAKAGRFRPYVLIGSLMMAVCGVGMFWSPFPKESMATLVWVWITNILFFGVATILFNQRYNMLSVSTRSLKDRNSATALCTAMDSMIPGVFVALLVMGWLYYVYLVPDTTGNVWRMFILIPAIISVPAAILEYFFTRERITEENRSMNAGPQHVEEPASLMTQIKYLLKNKYCIMAFIIGLVQLLCNYMQGYNSRTYFCQWILGATDQNGLAIIYLMIAMQPMFLGLFIVPPLARKFGSRLIMIVSSILVLVGVGICLIRPTDFAMACGGGMIFSLGMMAVSNMTSVFSQQASDVIEYEHGFRPEGTLAMGIIVAVYTAIASPFSALYETGLVKLGFDAYATAQPPAVNAWIIGTYYGSMAILAAFILIISIFFDAEKKMPEIHETLKERRKAAVLASGQEWVDEEEMERRKWEEAERIAEENRIADLKEKCRKKGLHFEEEEAKYQAKKNRRRKKKSR